MSLLQRGSKGDEVEALQRDLALLGFDVKADGIFGENTRSAVEQLQWMFGYTVDGKVGDGTRALIEAQKGHGWKATTPEGVKRALEAQGKKTDEGALAGADLSRTLSKGADGADVAYLQRKLIALGFDVGVDGKLGPSTEKAIRELQEAWGYNVDGMVGPATNRLIDAQIGYGWRRGRPTSASGAQPRS